MGRSRIAEIANNWMIPTSKTAYMAGLEKKPVIAAANGVKVIGTEGKEYLFRVGPDSGGARPQLPSLCRRGRAQPTQPLY